MILILEENSLTIALNALKIHEIFFIGLVWRLSNCIALELLVKGILWRLNFKMMPLTIGVEYHDGIHSIYA